MPFNRFFGFKFVEEVFVGELCFAVHSESSTELVEFLVVHPDHESIEHPTERRLGELTNMVIVKLVESRPQVL